MRYERICFNVTPKIRYWTTSLCEERKRKKKKTHYTTDKK